jgi:phage FluMu protein Com
MKCPLCEHEMTWNSDENADDMTDGNYQLVSFHECPSCKAWAEIYSGVEDGD